MWSRLLMLSLLLVSTALAHPGAHGQGRLSQALVLGEDALYLGVNVPGAWLDALSGAPIDFRSPLSPALQGQLKARLAPLLTEGIEVSVDGVRVRPQWDGLGFVQPVTLARLADPTLKVEGITLESGAWPTAQVTLRCPIKQAPNRIQLRWTLGFAYLGPPGKDAPTDGFLTTLDAGDGILGFTLTPKNPALSWARPTARPAVPHLEVEAPPPWRLHALSALLLVAGLALAVARRRLWPALSGGIMATAAWPVVWSLQFGPGVGPLPPEEAAERFGACLANLYRAFDYEKEGEVYDALAQSVDGPLLEQVYREIHQGLVLADEGGARSRVKRVVPLSLILRPVEHAEQLKVEARYQVSGEVSHFGHLHRRTNELTARFTLERRADAFKFVAVELLDQRRVDDLPPK